MLFFFSIRRFHHNPILKMFSYRIALLSLYSLPLDIDMKNIFLIDVDVVFNRPYSPLIEQDFVVVCKVLFFLCIFFFFSF